MTTKYRYIFCFILFHLFLSKDIEATEKRSVTPYLITMIHDQLFQLDEQLQLPKSSYHRDDIFLSGESSEEKELLWSIAKEEIQERSKDGCFHEPFFQEAFQSFFDAQEFVESDPITARYLLSQAALLVQCLWDEKSIQAILAEKIRETDDRLLKVSDEQSRYILEEDQRQNLHCYQKLFGLTLPIKSANKKTYNDFERNHYISERERDSVRPYLLPIDHPIKPALDSIFRAKRAILNRAAFLEAGFIIKFSQPRSFIKVASHPQLPGYLVKVHFDSTLSKKHGKESWRWLVQRVEGARKVRKAIEKKKSKHFVVPRKWLYPLPEKPSVPHTPDFVRKNVILVVQDMKLVPHEENLEAWKTKITEEHLKELYAIMKLAKGSSYRADNIAYTQSGKFAFIDTEYPNRKPNFHTIGTYLSTEMQAYWENLIRKKKK